MNLGKNKEIKIPIVLTSDNKYIPFMYVTMISLLRNANENTFYDFYLLISSTLKESLKENIIKLENKYKCNVNFIDMKDKFNNLPWTPAAYYRLLIADVVPKYDKCIYLDSDVYVCYDLNQLYNIDINENYVAGVIASSYYVYEDQHHCNILNIPSTKNYINSGVLLINLKQIRKDNITSKFIELLNSNQVLPSYDQDVINIVCYNKIKVLPPKYNMIVSHVFINDIRLNDLYTKEEIEEAKKKPCIIHYMCERKPWEGFLKYGSYWWKNAIKTEYKFYFIFVFIKSILNPIPAIKKLIKACFPTKIKTDIKEKIKNFVKREIGYKLEKELNSVKKQLAEQTEKINKQQEEIEKLKKQLKD